MTARRSSWPARVGVAAARASRQSGRCRASASRSSSRKSYAFIHKRNLVNEALPFLVVTDPAFYELVGEGATLEVNLATGRVRDVSSGREFQAERPSPIVQALQGEGGLVPAVKHYGKEVFTALTA